MAEKRRLLVEIEKCFKKIDEGVEIFEDTMSKVNEANSENQRDKLQDDLKKEIKKLQRLREQVKGWQGSSDIKDKEKLNHYRRLVETQMETFKNLEREFKTKPHSKQGLSAEDKLDPKEKEKAETLEWLNTETRKIQDEIDRTEAKIEAFSTAEATGKKQRGKSKDAKKAESEIDELKAHLEKMKFHWQNIEVCMRLITNEKLDAHEVITKLREPLVMYTDALDSDCDEDLENLEPDDIYEELGLGDYLSRLDAADYQALDDDALAYRNIPDFSAQTEVPPPVKHAPAELPKPAKPKSVVIAAPISQQVIAPVTSTPLPLSFAAAARPPVDDNASILSPSPQRVHHQNCPQDVSSPVKVQSVKLDFCFAGWPLRPPRQDVCAGKSQLANDPRFSRILTNNNFSERSHLPICRATNIPKSFPNRLLIGPIDDEYFEKLELGTVLFSFYYMEGTRAQLLAARRLKNCSWRFHTRYLMWFQRADEPTEITADFERGCYVFFDYERWDFYIYEDFLFKYKFLEA